MLFKFFRLGQACNHIAALLFFIEHHASNPELPSEVSKTSKAMEWYQPPKKVISSEVASNMKFVKPSHGDNPDLQAERNIKRSSFDPRLLEHRNEVNKDHLHTLLSQIQKSMPNTGLQQFWCDAPNPKPSASAADNQTLWNHVLFSYKACIWNSDLHSKCMNPSTVDCYHFLNNMKLSHSEVTAKEAATHAQSESELWMALRNGRLTSSRFGEILRRRVTTDSTRLVTDIMGYNGLLRHLPPALCWGQQNEAKARQCYVINRQVFKEDMIVEPTGLHLFPGKSFLGASSDGKVLCRNVDTCCYGCLEIKCPYSINTNVTIQLTPHEIADKFPDFYMQKGSDGQLHLSRSHPYYAQVQGEMAILDVEWCDFVVFSKGRLLLTGF